MKIALAQINPYVGDLEGNVDLCLDAIQQGGALGADLVVLPELAVPGYPPRDILYDSSFNKAVFEANRDLARRARGLPPTLFGTLVDSGERPPAHPGLYNAAVLAREGWLSTVATKRLLPVYDVYYEPRWFLPGSAHPPVSLGGKKVGVLVCEDLWDEGYDLHPAEELRAAGADVLVVINASPYRKGILARRLGQARRTGCPLVYVNMWGAQDELIFDGRSFAMDPEGHLLIRLPGFKESIRVIDLDPQESDAVSDEPPKEVTLFRALILGVRDFARKNRLERAFLGLSGGVDSSVGAVIAAEALGADRVTGVAIPSRYTDPRSTACARALAGALGMGFEVVELESLHATAESALADLMKGETTAAENVQARLRMIILMGFTNCYGGMLLNTSNKTELALGYATLYGDMAGALCPLADLTKPEVYNLARWINAERGLIPSFVLERPPSAELRPGQVDPFDYEAVGPAMERLVHANQSDSALRRSEHKRWQMGVILKVTEKAFGTGRMIPITRG